MKKAPPNLYDVIIPEGGKPSLVLLPASHFGSEDQLVAWFETAGRRLATAQDGQVHFEIAAGAAAEAFFIRGLHRRAGMTQEEFCRRAFDRDARTVRGWRTTAEGYEDIGGLNAVVQPSAYSQVLSVTKISRERRKEAWEASVSANDGNAPTGVQLLEWGRLNGALVSTRKKPDAPVPPTSAATELSPITTVEEAKVCLAALLDITAAVPRDDIRPHLERLMKFMADAFPTRRGKSKTKRAAAMPGQMEIFGAPAETSGNAA